MNSNLLIISILLFLIGKTLASPRTNLINDPNQRSKRFIVYPDSENRLSLPPGTLLVLTPTLQLPVYRNLPIGYGSHMTVSVPFSVNFDDLGWTSEENPWGLWPENTQKKKDQGIAGGNRKDMFQYLEGFLSNMGISGKACLQRAICEMYETPLANHGFLGELLELFFSVSKDKQADNHLSDYLEAEKLGKQNKSCSKYHSECKNPLFSKISIKEQELNTTNSRSKRFIVYPDSETNRLTLPPGTLLVMTPTLQVPVARNLPIGYGSHMTISIPFSINFDDLGMTSEENLWGLWPDFGKITREDWGQIPGVNLAGGDREIMFQVVEAAISHMGIVGKSCLLRSICEMFETPLLNHGFLAEALELFFSVSKAPEADTRLAEYLEAENLGKHNKTCSKYYSSCSSSIFYINGQKNNQTENIHTDGHPEKSQENQIKHIFTLS